MEILNIFNFRARHPQCATDVCGFLNRESEKNGDGTIWDDCRTRTYDNYAMATFSEDSLELARLVGCFRMLPEAECRFEGKDGFFIPEDRYRFEVGGSEGILFSAIVFKNYDGDIEVRVNDLGKDGLEFLRDNVDCFVKKVDVTVDLVFGEPAENPPVQSYEQSSVLP